MEVPILNLLTKTLKLLIFKYDQRTKENMRLMSSSREYKQRRYKEFLKEPKNNAAVTKIKIY